MQAEERRGLPLARLNHMSLTTHDVGASRRFYRDILGFQEVKRPNSLTFDGCWLFNSGSNIGIHLIGVEGLPKPKRRPINPRGNHLAFTTPVALADVQVALERAGVDFVCGTVQEGDLLVEQVFLHDPDGNMIEICNCDCLPVVPLSRAASCEGAVAALSGAACCPGPACSAPQAPSQWLRGDKGCAAEAAAEAAAAGVARLLRTRAASTGDEGGPGTPTAMEATPLAPPSRLKQHISCD